MPQAFVTRGGYRGAGGGGAQTLTKYSFGQAKQQITPLTYTPRQNRRGNMYKGHQPAGYNSNNRSGSVGDVGGYQASNRSFDAMNAAPPLPMSALNKEWIDAEKELFPDGPPIFAIKPSPAVAERTSAVLPPNSYGRAPGLLSVNLTALNSSGGRDNHPDANAASFQHRESLSPKQTHVPPNTPFYVERLAKEQNRFESLVRDLDSVGPQLSQLRNYTVNPDWISAKSAIKNSPTPNFSNTAPRFVSPTTSSASATAITTAATGNGVTSSPFCGGSVFIHNVTQNRSLTNTETATAPGDGLATTTVVTNGGVIEELIEINKTICGAYTKMIGILTKVTRDNN